LVPAHLPPIRVFHEDVAMMAMIGGCRDEPSSIDYLATHDRHWCERGFGFWLLRDLATAAAIGLAGLRVMPLDGRDELEVGYGFLPAWWGLGLATEILAAVLERGERLEEFEPMVAAVAPGNDASERVLAKLGFAFEREVVLQDRRSRLFRRTG